MQSLIDISLCDLVVLVLATYRVTLLVTRDDGPGCVLVRLRHLVGVRWDERGQPQARDGSVAKLMVCFGCASIYAALLVTLMHLLVPWGWVPTLLLAVSGGAILCDEAT